MKKSTKLTLIALLLSTVVFAQKGTPPGTQTAPSQTKVIVMGAFSNNIILLSPADGKLIGTTDASKPVLFRWTAVSPKPKEAVTYRLRVWQLMEGQNSTEAMRTNQPLVTKEVTNTTQTAIGNLYTGPCKPPYLCDFVWAVEAFIGDDKAAGKPNGASEHFSFKFNAEEEQKDMIKTSMENPAVESRKFDLTKTEFIRISVGDKKSYKIKKEDIEIYNPRERQCFCPDDLLTPIPCENWSKVCSKKPVPFEPLDPWWQHQAGKMELLEINAELQKMGMRLKKRETGEKTVTTNGQPIHGVDVKLGVKGINKSDKEVDEGHPTKSTDKRIDKSTPTVKSTDGQSDPVHGVDIKLRVKASKEAQATTYALYLPVEKTVYDASGNITGIMIKTEKGELDFVKVVVAGSHSLSGGYCILRTEKGEPVIAKVVVAGSNSLSPGVK